jgi:hypothetical protein
MSEAITIPSPSVFLRASPVPISRPDAVVDQQDLDDQTKSGSVKKRPTVRKKSMVAATSKPRRDGAAVTKPKQSKSRNGRFFLKKSMP